jgi:hypothetical protein
MVGLEKTEMAIKNRQTTNTVNIGYNTQKEETKNQTAKKTKMSNTNTTDTCKTTLMLYFGVATI